MMNRLPTRVQRDAPLPGQVQRYRLVRYAPTDTKSMTDPTGMWAVPHLIGQTKLRHPAPHELRISRCYERPIIHRSCLIDERPPLQRLRTSERQVRTLQSMAGHAKTRHHRSTQVGEELGLPALACLHSIAVHVDPALEGSKHNRGSIHPHATVPRERRSFVPVGRVLEADPVVIVVSVDILKRWRLHPAHVGVKDVNRPGWV